MDDTKIKSDIKSESDVESKLNNNSLNKFPQISEKFALWNKLITRDLNSTIGKPTFSLYTKDDITRYLKDPYSYQKQLRAAVIYIYGASTHFRRLIQYFVSLSDLSYVVSPYNIDPKTANTKTVGRN